MITLQCEGDHSERFAFAENAGRKDGRGRGGHATYGRTKDAVAANRSKKKRSESRAETTADEQIREILPKCR
jgi:hypothetical protein